MADRIIKPDSGNDVVIQNDDASAKIEINDNGSLAFSGSINDLQIDNVKIDGNTITSENTNGNIDLTPNGTGEVNISKVDIDSGTLDGVEIGGSIPSGKTLDVSAGTLTTSTAQKDAIVDGSTGISRSGNNITFAGDIDVNGNKIILDADADSYFKAGTDDEIDIFLANSTPYNFKFRLPTGYTRFSAGFHASYADDSTLSIPIANMALIHISHENSGYAVLFFATYVSGTAIVSDPSSQGRTTDTDGYICCYKGANSNTVTFKNRFGGTGNFRIGVTEYV